jgi:hypothetical protein
MGVEVVTITTDFSESDPAPPTPVDEKAVKRPLTIGLANFNTPAGIT